MRKTTTKKTITTVPNINETQFIVLAILEATMASCILPAEYSVFTYTKYDHDNSISIVSAGQYI